MVDQLTLQTIGILLTGLTVSIAAIYYTMTLRYTRRNQELQLENRQAQLFMNIYNQDMQRPNIKAQNACLEMEFDNVEEFEEKYSLKNNPEAFYDWQYHCEYMEGMGVLVREGYINIRLVALLSSGMIRVGWEKFAPVIKEYRVRYNWPRYGIEYEYLYNELMKFAEKHPELQINP